MAGKQRPRSVAAEKAALAPGRRFFGPEAMGVVVAALRRGATIAAAAGEAGFARETVNEWRKKAPHFDAACRDALDGREALVVRAAGGGRGWRLSPPRCNAFTERRKQVYLDHLAATGDRGAAAAVAGVSTSTVSNHRRNDPVFAEGCRQALALAYENLEAEAVRDRLAAMERIDVDPERAGVVPAEEFDRTLALLREHNKAPRSGRPPTLCSLDDGFAALERELDAFHAREGKKHGGGGERGNGDGGGQ
jgi:hypothetical protein